MIRAILGLVLAGALMTGALVNAAFGPFLLEPATVSDENPPPEIVETPGPPGPQGP